MSLYYRPFRNDAKLPPLGFMPSTNSSPCLKSYENSFPYHQYGASAPHLPADNKEDDSQLLLMTSPHTLSEIYTVVAPFSTDSMQQGENIGSNQLYQIDLSALMNSDAQTVRPFHMEHAFQQLVTSTKSECNTPNKSRITHSYPQINSLLENDSNYFEKRDEAAAMHVDDNIMSTLLDVDYQTSSLVQEKMIDSSSAENDNIMASLLEVDYHTSVIQQPEKINSSVSAENDIMASLLEVDYNTSAVQQHDIMASLLDADYYHSSTVQPKAKVAASVEEDIMASKRLAVKA
jgi:hypothetical protein